MKRVIVGAIWCVVLYFAACMVVGGAAGGIATSGMKPGDDPAAIGAAAGTKFVDENRRLIGFAAVAVAVGGTYFRKLPGTRN